MDPYPISDYRVRPKGLSARLTKSITQVPSLHRIVSDREFVTAVVSISAARPRAAPQVTLSRFIDKLLAELPYQHINWSTLYSSLVVQINTVLSKDNRISAGPLKHIIAHKYFDFCLEIRVAAEWPGQIWRIFEDLSLISEQRPNSPCQGLDINFPERKKKQNRFYPAKHLGAIKWRGDICI